MKTRSSIGFVLGAVSVALACSPADRSFGDGRGGESGADSSGAGASGSDSTGKGGSSQAAGGAGSGGTDTNPQAGGGAGGSSSGAGAGGGAESGAGGQSNEGGSGGECPESSCCVDGKSYSASQKNPTNACAHCDPAKSVTTFVSLADSTSCGTGCVCNGGSTTETGCADKTDNDGDGQTNCADSDCSSRACATLVTAKVFTTRDAQERSGQGAGIIEDEDTISVSSAPSSLAKAILTFDTVPRDPAFEVVSAKLFFYMSNASEIAKIIFDADDGGLAGNYGEFTPIRFATGYQNVDMTKLVKEWVSGKVAKRTVFMSWAGEIPGGTTVRASEYAGTSSDPYLEITYSSKCNADKECPQP